MNKQREEQFLLTKEETSRWVKARRNPGRKAHNVLEDLRNKARAYGRQRSAKWVSIIDAKGFILDSIDC